MSILEDVQRSLTGTIDTDYEDDEDDDDDNMSKSKRLYELTEMEQRDLELRKKRARHAFIVLLASMSFSSFSYCSVISNLFLLLNMNPLHWDADHATTLLLVFGCFCCMFAVLSGWLTDCHYSQYNIIVCGHVPYLIGLGLFSTLGYGQMTFINAMEDEDIKKTGTLLESMCVATDAANSSLFLHQETTNCEYFVYSALVILSAGVGTLNVNLPLFIFAQVEVLKMDPRRFFNWFMFSQILGSLISTLLVCFIQQNVNFYYGYLIGFFAMFISLLIFAVGSVKYEKPEPNRKSYATVFQVLKYSMSDEARERQKEAMKRGEKRSLVDLAMERFDGPFPNQLVDAVRTLMRLVPVLLSFSSFWVLYYQTVSSFVTQGLHMKLVDLSKVSDKFILPAVWLNLFSYIPILILILVAETLVIPILQCYQRMPNLQTETRILIGYFCAFLALLSAGIVEYVRINQFNACKMEYSNNASLVEEHCIMSQYIGGTSYHATDFSIFYQVPQYLFMGFAQFFALNGCLEFAFNEAPHNMKGLVMGLLYVSTGVGSLIATFLSEFAKKINWYCHSESFDYCNPNSGKMYNYFWILAVFQFAAIFVYYAFAAFYRAFRERGEVRSWAALCCFICRN